jgi:hypothetical protein
MLVLNEKYNWCYQEIFSAAHQNIFKLSQETKFSCPYFCLNWYYFEQLILFSGFHTCSLNTHKSRTLCVVENRAGNSADSMKGTMAEREFQKNTLSSENGFDYWTRHLDQFRSLKYGTKYQ